MTDSPLSGQRTPPLIVASSDMPRVALTMFIAQELETWGFGIRSGDKSLIVTAGDRVFVVGVEDAGVSA